MRGASKRRIAALVIGGCLLLVSTAALAMPQALVYVGALILEEYLVAGIILIVVGTVWGQAEQRKAASEAEASARATYNSQLKDRMLTVVEPDYPLVYVYGKDQVVGTRVVNVLTTGNRDQYHHLICVHADHESEAINDIEINGKWLGALDANGNVTAGAYYSTHPVDATEYKSGTVFTLAHTPRANSLRITWLDGSVDNGTVRNMPYELVGNQVTVSASHDFTCSYQWTEGTPRVRVIKRLGTAGTPADAVTIAECAEYALANGTTPEYTATDTLDGKTATIIRVDIDNDELRGGLPRIRVKMNGKLVHDVRDPSFPNDVPVCSDNNVLCIADYLMSPMCSVPWTDLPLDDYIAQANICDTVKTFGALYTLGGVVRADQSQPQVLEAMALSMAGTICSTTWAIKAGAYSAPVMDLSQDDIIADFNCTSGASDSDIFNTVKGRFVSADNLYTANDYKPYRNEVYFTSDGEEKAANIDLPFTDRQRRADNIFRILMEDSRNAFTVTGAFRLKAWKLKIGDRITWTSTLTQQTGKIMRVMEVKKGYKQYVFLKLKEDAASIWDLADARVVDSTPNTNMPNPFDISPPESLTCTSGTDVLQVAGDGTIISRIYVSWPLPTTQGVVHGGYTEIEYRKSGVGAWAKVTVTGDDTDVYLGPVKDGLYYQIRARCINPVLNIKSMWLYTDHQVIGKTELPTAVSVITATPTLLNVVLQWEQIEDADRLDYLIADDTGAGLMWTAYAGAEAKLPPASAGLHTYRIKSRDTSKLIAATEATCQITINAPSAPSLAYAIKDGMVELSWNDCTGTHQVKNYLVLHGASWAEGVFVGRADTRSLRITPDWTGSRTFWVAGTDIANNEGAPTSIVVTITAAVAPVLTGVFADAELQLSWTKPASTLPIDMYVLGVGATWETAIALGTFKVTAHNIKANWIGSQTFWVAAIDSAGNVGAADALEVSVTAAAAPTIITEVIDNNVLLRWSCVAGTLPITGYELRKGGSWASGEPIGEKSGSFTIVFETAAGVYTYWLAAIDSAGNYGTPGQISATVNQPPDYVLKADYDSLLDGTKSNMALHGDADNSLIGPVNTTETFAEHFSTRSWTSPQDQINAGYPVYAQPNLSPAYYEETIDYGVVLASNRITITPTTVDVVGAVVQSCKISVSADGVSYTDYDGVWQIYATSFRYVKYRITFTAGNTTDLVELIGINIRLDSKLKTVTKMVSCVAGDAGGTTVYLTDDWTSTGTKLFIDVDAIMLTPAGTTPITPTYDFVDDPNPLSLKILLFDAAGARYTGTCSMTVRGF